MNIFKDQLRSKEVRVTAARVAVLEVLNSSSRPLDISEILLTVAKNHVDVDQATIYRIVDYFTKKDLVNRLQFQDKKFFYEAKNFDHHHAICQKCGSIEDILDCSIDKVEKKIEENKGFMIKSHSLEFFGICKNCRKTVI